MLHFQTGIESVVAPPGSGQQQLDVLEALLSHVRWKKRLSGYIKGDGEVLDPDTLNNDSHCSLGQWLHGDGDHRYGDNVRFNELKELHAEFHHRAAEIVRAVHQGEGEKARALLEHGEFSRAARRINVLLARISLEFEFTESADV